MPIMPAEESDANPRERFFDLIGVCWRQWRVERQLRGRGIDFRSTDPELVRAAYAHMSPAEFAAINGRHAWANARTLRKSLAGLIPDRPVRTIDLGSGSGTSTRVLARLLPRGSRIVGLEFTNSLAEAARRQRYVAADGSPQQVTFAVGSVAETFIDAEGGEIASGTADLVNASGVLGHHLNEAGIVHAVDEVHRVLASGGIAALDVGPNLSAARLTDLMRARGFTRLRRSRGQPFDRTGQVVFHKSISSSDWRTM